MTTRIRYDRWVGLSVPEESVDAANAVAVSMTGNPADGKTFIRHARAKDGTVHYVAKTPMRESKFQDLPALQQALGGQFGTLSVREGDVWHEVSSFDDWLDSVGLVLEQRDDDFGEEGSH